MCTPVHTSWRPLVALLMLSACAHTQSPTSGTGEPWYGDLHALAAEAAAVRGMKLTIQFAVVPLDDDAFFAEYNRIAADSTGALQKELSDTLWEFFGGDLSKLEALSAGVRGEVKSVRQEQLLAFYHFPTHRLIVRRSIPAALVAGGERTRLLALAHEVGHALQDQLGLTLSGSTNFDESLALHAVFEGDATLTAILVDAHRNGVLPSRAVERSRLSLQMLSTSQLLEVSGLSPQLSTASPMVRDLFLFPYFQGQRFISDLYQTGGFPLVERALRNPPKRTDDIFSPQRWLDGSTARFEPLSDTHRRLGLVMLRAMMEQCQAKNPQMSSANKRPMSSANNKWIETHYKDDSFRRAGSTLTWVTEWDTSMTAQETSSMHTVLELDPSQAESIKLMHPQIVFDGLFRCFDVPESDQQYAPAGEVLAVVVGGPSADRERLAQSAVKTPLIPGVAALAGQHIPPPSVEAAYRPAGQGTLTDDSWAHEKLGLKLQLTDAKVIPNGGAALTAIVPGAALLVTFIDETPNPKNNNGFVNGVLDAFLRASKLDPAGFSLSTKHEWTDAHLTWTTGSLETRGAYDVVRVRALVIPLCKGTASVDVVAMAFSPAGQRQLDTWLSTLKGYANPSICADP